MSPWCSRIRRRCPWGRGGRRRVWRSPVSGVMLNTAHRWCGSAPVTAASSRIRSSRSCWAVTGRPRSRGCIQPAVTGARVCAVCELRVVGMWPALVPEVDVVDGGLPGEGVEGVIDVAERESARVKSMAVRGSARVWCGSSAWMPMRAISSFRVGGQHVEVVVPGGSDRFGCSGTASPGATWRRTVLVRLLSAYGSICPVGYARTAVPACAL